MSRIGVIDPTRLPRMAVLETIDTEVIIAARMERLVALWTVRDPPAGAVYDVDSLEFDPIRINQEVSTYFELLLRDRVNQAARSVTLAYAIGSDLDAIASRYPGGMPRLVGETDARYRRRVWLSPNLLSPHGSEEAYVFWALTADPTLRDASAITTEGTGEITLTVMAEGTNPKPTDTQLLAVRAYIMGTSRKGLTDVLNVVAPIVYETDYKIRVWLYPAVDRASTIATIEENLAALVEKQRWLGFDHTLLAINGALNIDGVANAKIDEPIYDMLVGPRGVVKVNTIEVIYAGITE